MVDRGSTYNWLQIDTPQQQPDLSGWTFASGGGIIGQPDDDHSTIIANNFKHFLRMAPRLQWRLGNGHDRFHRLWYTDKAARQQILQVAQPFNLTWDAELAGYRLMAHKAAADAAKQLAASRGLQVKAVDLVESTKTVPVRQIVQQIVREASADDYAVHSAAENALIDYDNGDSSSVPKVILFAIYEQLALAAWSVQSNPSQKSIEQIRQQIETGAEDKIAGVFDDLIDIAIYAGAEGNNYHRLVPEGDHWFARLQRAVGHRATSPSELSFARKVAKRVISMAAEARSGPTAESSLAGWKIVGMHKDHAKARKTAKTESAADYPEGWLTNKGGGDHWTGAQSSWRIYKGPHGSLLAGTIFPDLSGRMFTALHELTGAPPAPNDEKAWHKLMMRKSGNLMFKGWKSGSLAALQRAVDTEAAKYL